METFKHTIDNEKFKLNAVIDTDIIAFKLYDKDNCNTFLIEFNKKYINDRLRITLDDFKKIVIHSLLNNEKLNYIYTNYNLVIFFEFAEIKYEINACETLKKKPLSIKYFLDEKQQENTIIKFMEVNDFKILIKYEKISNKTMFNNIDSLKKNFKVKIKNSSIFKNVNFMIINLNEYKENEEDENDENDENDTISVTMAFLSEKEFNDNCNILHPNLSICENIITEFLNYEYDPLTFKEFLLKKIKPYNLSKNCLEICFTYKSYEHLMYKINYSNDKIKINISNGFSSF